VPKPSSSPSDPLWQTFVAAIAADTDSVGLTAARIAELPSYRTIPLAELVPDTRRNFASGLRRLQERRLATTDQDLSAYEKSGGQRARQGVTLADMLQGFSIAMAVSRAGAYRSAPPGEHRETLLLEAIEIMASSNTEGMNAAAAAHRQVEFELARQEQHDVANIVRRVLFGSIGGRAQLGHLERYGIDPTRRYHADPGTAGRRLRPRGDRALARHLRVHGAAERAGRADRRRRRRVRRRPPVRRGGPGRGRRRRTGGAGVARRRVPPREPRARDGARDRTARSRRAARPSG